MIARLKKIKKGEFKESIFFPIFLCLLFLAIIGFLAFSNWKISQKRQDLISKIEALKEEIQVLEKRNAELRAGINRTQSEEYQKEKLYEQGYVQEGEQQVVVLPPKEEEQAVSKEKNLWQKLLDPVRNFFEGL